MKTLMLALAASALALTGCGSSSTTPAQAPDRDPNGTQVNVNGESIYVTETTLYGYTCIIGVGPYLDTLSPGIWCDPNSKGSNP